jgi:hypothetical protein
VIVHAAGSDLRAEVAADPASCTPAPCAPGGLTVDHSAFADSDGPLANGGANIAGDVGFVNSAALDFRLAPGSPAIDAGLPDALTQGTDRDLNLRFQGAALDLGAYEATPVPQAPSSPGAGGAPAVDGTAPQATAADLTAPTLSAVRVTTRVFAVGRGATAVSAGKAVKRGTTLRFKLSEAAAVKIELARRSSGKRYRHVVTLTRKGRAGANSAKLTGRIGRRAMKPGAYRATLTARDSAGNVSRKVAVNFTIVSKRASTR